MSRIWFKTYVWKLKNLKGLKYQLKLNCSKCDKSEIMKTSKTLDKGNEKKYKQYITEAFTQFLSFKK